MCYRSLAQKHNFFLLFSAETTSDKFNDNNTVITFTCEILYAKKGYPEVYLYKWMKEKINQVNNNVFIRIN